MAGRQYHVNGETMIAVKNAAFQTSSTFLGLTDVAGKVTINFDPKFSDINVDAWGNGTVPETQAMLMEASIDFTLVHFDRNVLNSCIQLALGNAGSIGTLARAGTLMGGNAGRFAAGNNYVGLNLYSPVEGVPWRFYFTYLQNFRWPLGTEKSLVQCSFRAIPYIADPWNNGQGANGVVFFDNTLDT